MPESPDPYTGNARNGPGFLEEVVIKRGEDSRGTKAGLGRRGRRSELRGNPEGREEEASGKQRASFHN